MFGFHVLKKNHSFWLSLCWDAIWFIKFIHIWFCLLVVAPKKKKTKFHSYWPCAWMLCASCIWFSYELFWQWLHWKNHPSCNPFFILFFIMHHIYIFLVHLSFFYHDPQFYMIKISQFYNSRNYILTEYKNVKTTFFAALNIILHSSLIYSVHVSFFEIF